MNQRQKVLGRLDKSWSEFKESYAGLSQTGMLKSGVVGKWSIRDIIVHVTSWEEEALKHLPVILQGGRPRRYSVLYGGIDAFNAMITENRKNLSFREVLRQQDFVHRQLVELIESVPEEHLGGETKFRHRLRLDTYGHYRKHAAAIRNWRERITNYE